MAVIALWGLTIEPGHVESVTPKVGELRIINASLADPMDDELLECRTFLKMRFAVAEGLGPTINRIVTLCSLVPGQVETSPINITLPIGKKVDLEVTGDNAVCLVGHYQDVQPPSESLVLSNAPQAGHKRARRSSPERQEHSTTSKALQKRPEKHFAPPPAPAPASGPPPPPVPQLQPQLQPQPQAQSQAPPPPPPQREVGQSSDASPRPPPPILSLALEDIFDGDGSISVQVGDVVAFKMLARLYPSGEIFYESEESSFKVGNNEVIPGLDDGVRGMRIRGQRRIIIPAIMAWGALGNDAQNVPPDTAVYYDCQLLDIKRRSAQGPEASSASTSSN